MLTSRHATTITVAIAALMASLLAGIIAHGAFLNRPITTDENSYYFQSRNFISGQIARPYPPVAPAFFHKMIIQDPEVGWLSRYAPGHPFWLLPGAWFHQPRLMSLIGAGLALALLCWVAFLLGAEPWIAAGLVLISPFFLFMYGTLLSHTSGLISAVLMLGFYIQWQRNRRLLDAALAGLFWGLLFLNRTYTAFLIALPFGCDALASLAYQRNKKNFYGCTAFAMTSLGFFVIYRLYNKVAVGSSRATTFLFYDPSEGLGFGPRHTSGLVIHHTLQQGLMNLWENIQQFDEWVFGYHGGIMLLVLLALLARSRRWTPMMVAAPLFIWGGYVLFWFPGIEAFRPIYLFESLAFLMPLAALGLTNLLKRFPMPSRIICMLGIMVTSLMLSFPFVKGKITFYRDLNHRSAEYRDLIDKAPKDALILIKGHGDPVIEENLFNPDGLDSVPLIARYNPHWNAALCQNFPERTPWILTRTSPPRLEPYRLPPNTSITIQAINTHHFTGQNITSADSATRVREARPPAKEGLLLYGRYPYLSPGKWQVVLDAHWQQIDPQYPARFEIATDNGATILKHQEISGNAEAPTITLEITVTDITQIEPRVHYGGSGQLQLKSIAITQAP